MRVDHVAIEVADLDGRVDHLCSHVGMSVVREGRLTKDPTRRIVMLGDGHGFKLELVEKPTTSDTEADALLHLAWLVDDVDRTYEALVGAGSTPVTQPRRLEPARSRTATVQPPSGAPIQLVAYDDNSPDR